MSPAQSDLTCKDEFMREAAFSNVAAAKISALTGSDPRANLRITSQRFDEWQAASASTGSAPCSPRWAAVCGSPFEGIPTHAHCSESGW